MLASRQCTAQVQTLHKTLEQSGQPDCTLYLSGFWQAGLLSWFKHSTSSGSVLSQAVHGQHLKWLRYNPSIWNSATTWRPANHRPCRPFWAAADISWLPNFRYTKPCAAWPAGEMHCLRHKVQVVVLRVLPATAPQRHHPYVSKGSMLYDSLHNTSILLKVSRSWVPPDCCGPHSGAGRHQTCCTLV